MIASLMMYQRPELVGAHERYWALIRNCLVAAGVDSPQTLSQDAEEFAVWRDSGLVLSQTCGMPYRTELHDKVSLVGTPDFGVAGCVAGYYRSALVVRADEPRSHLSEFKEAVFAYNQTFSQSGYAAAYWHIKPQGFWFKRQLVTGQHKESARAVAEGRADIAALDAVSWRLMRRYEPFTQSLQVLEWTEPTPGLPLITALHNDRAVIFAAVKDAIAALLPADRSALGIKDLVWIPPADYLAIQNPALPDEAG